MYIIRVEETDERASVYVHIPQRTWPLSPSLKTVHFFKRRQRGLSRGNLTRTFTMSVNCASVGGFECRTKTLYAHVAYMHD